MSDSTYADGSYGESGAPASHDLERDQHATFADQQSAVLALAYDAGPRGITGHDVQVATGWGDSSKSRALSNLLRDGKVARLAEKRDRGHIHVLPEHVAGRDLEPYVSIAEKHYGVGYAEGVKDAYIVGLQDAFTCVEDSDTIGDAMIALRALIEKSEA